MRAPCEEDESCPSERVGRRKARRRGRGRADRLPVDRRELDDLADAEARREARQDAGSETASELDERPPIPGDALLRRKCMQEPRLHAGDRDRTGDRNDIRGSGRRRVSEDERRCFPRGPLPAGGSHLADDGTDASWRRLGNARHELIETVVPRLEAIVGTREVDRHEEKRSASANAAQQASLMGEAAQKGFRCLRRWGGCRIAVGIRRDVAHARRIGIMERRLCHNDRPPRMSATHCGDSLDHRVLLVIHRAHHDQYQMRLRFRDGEILGRVIARLAETPRIEKAYDRRLARKIEDACRLGARAKARSDLGLARAGDGLDDGALAGLHLADEPDHRGLGRRCLRDGVGSRISFRSFEPARPHVRHPGRDRAQIGKRLDGHACAPILAESGRAHR